jgi:hypothetical protein
MLVISERAPLSSDAAGLTHALQLGCRYACFWGEACEEWHDLMDELALPVEEERGDPDTVVMTTWHAKEPLQEAMWFLAFCANEPDRSLSATLLCDTATHNRESYILEQFKEALLAEL